MKVISLGILLFIIGFCLGAGYMFDKNLVITAPEIRFEVPMPEIIDNPVPAPFVVTHTETMIETIYPGTGRWFESSPKLQEWLNANKVEDMGSKRCVAEVIELCNRATRDGYRIGWQADFGRRMQPDQEWAAYASTWIGKNLWFINPVSGVKWKAGHALRPIE